MGNNHVHITEYDDQDMIKYCIDGDDTDVITTATIDDIEEGESFDWMNKVGGGGLRSKWNRPELVRVDS